MCLPLFRCKKISVPEFLRSARSSFLLFPIKKENRQRLYNLLSIFILKLITIFCVKSKLNDPCCIADTGEYSKEHSHLPFYLQLCSICPNRCAVWCYCIYQHGTGLITEIILFIPVDPSCFHITFFIKEIP